MENTFKAITKGGDDRAKAQARDFVDRVTTGDPLQGFSDEEVRESAAILKQLSPEQRQRAMAASVQNVKTNMSENDRSSLNEMLRQRQAGQGMVDITRSGENVQPGSSAGAQGGGGLDDLLGGLLGGGGGLDDLLGGLLGGSGGGSSQSGGGGLGDILGGLLGGGGSTESGAVEQAGGGGGGIGDMLGDLMKGPAGKAIIAGAAAYAMKELI